MKSFFKYFALLLVVAMLALGAYSLIEGRPPFVGGTQKSVSFTDLGTVHSVRVETAAGKVTFVQGSALSVKGENVFEDFVCENKDGVLTIYNRGPFLNWFFSHKTEITVTLPAGTSLDLFDLTANAGSVRLDVPLQATATRLTLNAGSIEAESLQGTDFRLAVSAGKARINKAVFSKGEVKVSAGDGRLENAEFGKASVSVSAGEARLEGQVKDLTATVSAGSARFDLAGSKSDYRITSHRSAGSLNINGSSQANGTSGPQDSGFLANLSVSAGGLDIRFAKD